MAWQAIASISIFVLVTSASPVPDSYAIHEIRSPVSRRWNNTGRVSAHSILPVRVGLVQTNLDNAADFLMDVSDPESPNYGKHWTSQQVIDAFKPTDETTNAVLAWLDEAGIHNVTISDNKAWLAFNRPASLVENLLHTEFEAFEDTLTGHVVPSAERYHVPRAIQHHIDYITPGIRLLADNKRIKMRTPMASKVRRSVDSIDPKANEGTKHCDEAIVPDCLSALYQIPKATLKPNPKNVMGIYESEAERWLPTDLNLFFANFTAGRIPNGTVPINYAIDGGESESKRPTVPPSYGGEVALDLDMAYTIVYPQKVAIYDENDFHYQSILNDTYTFGFNQLLDAIDGSYCTYKAYGEKGDDPHLDPKYPDPEKSGGYNGTLECGVFKPPYVLSVSYGGQENYVPIAYQRRQCNEWLKIGLMGTSVFFASGDAGVGDDPSKFLGGESPTGCIGEDYRAFNPAWPNTCPWLTNVGATEVYPGSTVHQKHPESAVYVPDPKNINASFASGGGFSNIYPIPKYQKAAVEQYFAKHNPIYGYYSKLAKVAPNPVMVNVSELQGGDPNKLYNRIGRGVPDVSANGINGVVVLDGQAQLSGGTSMSTPIFASIVNRIVEERLAKGKGPLGFINPALYSNPGVLNDVVNGSNPACGTPGFKTAPGWDPASGLGTPNYPKMLDLFLSLK